MSHLKSISSVQNPLIKKTLLLREKSRERKKTGLFIIEGRREMELAKKGGYLLDTIFFCPEISPDSEIASISNNADTKIVHVTKEVYEKIAYRESTEGILCIVEAKRHHLSAIGLPEKNPLVLVAEAPEKPGNIGALLRTADAAAVDAVLIANPKSDIYNPNIVRSSVGCVFTTQIGMGSSEEIIEFLGEKHINIYCAALSASKNYTTCNFTKPTAIVVGTESTGLSDKWLRASHENIVIPMQGQIDSMNVSVSAAILIFEAKRQRGF